MQTVTNIVYCNRNKNIVNFLQFPEPVPKDQVKPEEAYKGSYAFGIMQFTDGTYEKLPAKK